MVNKVKKEEDKVSMPLGKKNYIIIGVAALVLIIGFILLSGGGVSDTRDFSYDIFSTRRIVVAPIVLVLGYVLVGVGIMKKFDK